MNQIRLVKKIFCLSSLLLILNFSSKAIETEIRYKVTGVKLVNFVWGVNDWQKYPKKVPGSYSKGKSIRMPMKREGDEYVVRVDIDSGYIVNYAFMFVKEAGPFKIDVSYWDMDDFENTKGYIFRPEDRKIIRQSADMTKLGPSDKTDFGNYARNLLLVFGLSAALLYLLRKFYYKNTNPVFNQFGYFVAVCGGLTLMLFFIRAYLSGQLDMVLFEPLDALWQMLGAAWDDMKYVGILVVFFGVLFLWLKKWRRTVLITYSLIALLSVVAALANLRVVPMLGRPFNYQWFYYSGFLKSRDASLAFAANVNTQFVMGILMMLIASSAMVWLLYQLYHRKKMPTVLLFPVLFVVALAAQFSSKTPKPKTANPILFFTTSAFSEDASLVANKNYAGKSDFENKHTDSLPAPYATSFKQGKIKNVVFFVLESTPWEYLTPYNNTIKATPFLEEYKNKAVFEKVYAHIPSTNKSMFSFLCGTYPELSYKSITLEHPDFPLPSIPSELKNYGYRTAFFNSGDNQFQNAGVFLKAREFEVVEDFRQGNCNQKVFSDKRYAEDNLDGVDDSCLSARLFNWMAQDTSKPFFAMMWTFQTHYPYFTTGEQKNYKSGNGNLERYLNALNRADETLKEIVKGLKDRGLLESTLIVVCGDHGEAFGRHNQTTHGSSVYEENLHVPLIFLNPLLFNNERLPAVGGISDIAPSIFSILNKPVPTEWQGENLFSLKRRERVYFFNPYNEYLFGFREGNMKYIYNITVNTGQVFNLVNDPKETTDISKENETFVKEAKEKLNAWIYYQDEYMKKCLQKNSSSTAK